MVTVRRGNHRRFQVFEVVQQFEQAADPNNRITLTRRTDCYGLPIARVRTHVGGGDLDSALVSQDLLAQELERSGTGRVVKQADAEFPNWRETGGIHHQMGGTRMHVDPKRGVVDGNGQVHEVPGLYVTGGSVFPTGGYANPTLTILALAFRLADHLTEGPN